MHRLIYARQSEPDETLNKIDIRFVYKVGQENTALSPTIPMQIQIMFFITIKVHIWYVKGDFFPSPPSSSVNIADTIFLFNIHRKQTRECVIQA